MEKLKQILMELKADIGAKKMTLCTRDGMRLLALPENGAKNSNSALDAAILGSSELRIHDSVVLIEGRHEKILIVGAGSVCFLSVELFSEERIFGEIGKKIEAAARIIAENAK